MVVKDEELGEIDLARVKLISDKKRQIEETADQVRKQIKGCFERLTEALQGRERQLLRQVEAIHRQQLSLVQSNLELLPAAASSTLQTNLDGDVELIERLINFGKIELSNSIAVNDAEPYKVEEYVEAAEDIVSFDKSLKSESDEFDVTSVIRRKRDSSGNHSKNISINLNCTSCEACKFASDNATTVPASPKLNPDDSPITPSTSSESSKCPFKESSTESSPLTEEKSPPPITDNNPTPNSQSENVFFETDKKTSISDANDASNVINDNNEQKVISVDDEETASTSKDDGKSEHPIQIQQWLKQILAETETEPIIHEIGQFTEISNARLYREFPVET